MKKSIISFVAVLLMIAVLCATAAFGLNLGVFSIPSVLDEERGIRRGLDLVGGSVITYEAVLPEGFDMATLDENMNIAMAMIRKRLTAKNFTEAQVSKQGTERISVEIPDVKNPEEAVQTLGKTAQLQFQNAEGETVLTGTGVKKAIAIYDYMNNNGMTKEHYIQLELHKDAQAAWKEATKAAANAEAGKNYIQIVMDEEIISAPGVSAEYKETGIDSTICTIAGSFTAESAAELADLINIGQMPFNLNQVELRSVGPQLGDKALSTSLFAALIGVIMIALFMIFMYRMPGVVATISLAFYIGLVTVVLTIFRVNLSLPGIAGIILSIGMAVDANVVIFERVKEEIKSGKSTRAAIDSGFDRAFSAIFDSNITTIIAAVVLYFFGTGPVVGFAMTLGIGVVVSMFTALTVTHFLLNRLVDMKVRNPKLYGA